MFIPLFDYSWGLAAARGIQFQGLNIGSEASWPLDCQGIPYDSGSGEIRENHPRGLIFEGYMTFQQK